MDLHSRSVAGRHHAFELRAIGGRHAELTARNTPATHKEMRDKTRVIADFLVLDAHVAPGTPLAQGLRRAATTAHALATQADQALTPEKSAQQAGAAEQAETAWAWAAAMDAAARTLEAPATERAKRLAYSQRRSHNGDGRSRSTDTQLPVMPTGRTPQRKRTEGPRLNGSDPARARFASWALSCQRAKTGDDECDRP